MPGSRLLPYGHAVGDTVYGDYTDDEGNSSGYYYDRPYYADLIQQGIQAFGGRANAYGGFTQPYRQQPYGYPQQQGFSAGGANPQGIQINWPIVALIGVGVLIFMSGKRR
jgi:hypothetical protein